MYIISLARIAIGLPALARQCGSRTDVGLMALTRYRPAGNDWLVPLQSRLTAFDARVISAHRLSRAQCSVFDFAVHLGRTNVQ
jgi:hypothetical protein